MGLLRRKLDAFARAWAVGPRCGARAGALCSMLALLGCVPDVDRDESILLEPRILAIAAEPAELAPGQTATYRALYADGGGLITEARIDWAYCVARKPLAELGPVSPVCLEQANEALIELGAGTSVMGTIPRDACRLFGPDPPPAMAGEAPGRPVDPDVTGGYRQPVRAREPELGPAVFFEHRIACGFAGVDPVAAAELTRRYRRNAAPAIDALEWVRPDGTRVALTDTATSVPAGAPIQIVARWAECPVSDSCGDGICGIDETRADCAGDCANPSGCTGAERYLRFDPSRRAIAQERESIRIAWYATAGTLVEERTGVAADEIVSESANRWEGSPQDEALVVAVIRDARGGVGWRTARLRAE